jgi:hypothetical protein
VTVGTAARGVVAASAGSLVTTPTEAAIATTATNDATIRVRGTAAP